MVDFDKPPYPTQQLQAGGYAREQAPAAQYDGFKAMTASRPRFSEINANWPWVVVAAIFFWPLSFAAAGAAGRVVPAMLDGDFARAYAESRRARKLGIISLCISFGLFLLVMAVYVIVIVAIVKSTCSSGVDC